jgi:hypothetical protein
MVAVLAGFGLVSLTGWVPLFRTLRAAAPVVARRVRTASFAARAGGVLVGALLAATLVAALAPSTGWDANTYHLVIPEIYLQNGGMVAFETIAGSFFQLFPQMQYLFLMGLGWPLAAQVLPWCFLICLFVLIMRVGTVFGRGSRWLPVALLASVPAVWFATYEVLVDVQGWFYFTLGACYAAYGLRTGRRGVLLPGAALIGMAVGGKVTNALLLGFFPVWLYALPEVPPQRRYRDALAGVFVAVLFALPWYAQGLAEKGNPIWPFFPTVITPRLLWIGVGAAAVPALAGLWGVPRLHRLLAAQPERGWRLIGVPALLLAFAAGLRFPTALPVLWDKLAAILAGPVLMTFAPERFGGDAPRLGPLVLAILPFVWFVGRGADRLGRWTLIWFATFYVAWLSAFSLNDSRHVMTIFPLLFVLVGGVLSERLRRAAFPRFSRVAAAFLLLALLYNLSVVGKVLLPRLAVVAGAQTPADYLTAAEEPLYPGVLKIPEYAVYRAANTQLPADAKVLVVGEYQWYYLDVPFLNGRPDQQSLINYPLYPTPAALLAYLRGLGVTHVIAPAAGDLFGLDALEALLAAGVRLSEANGVGLYSLPDAV